MLKDNKSCCTVDGKISVGRSSGNVMTTGFRVILETRSGVLAPPRVRERGSAAAHRALSALGDGWLQRLQPLCEHRREDLDGIDYLDSSVIEYALFKALEAAYPRTGGEPPVPLTRSSFVLRIVKEPHVEVLGIGE